jgi:DNA-binding response OmpR family regulator
MHSQTLPMLPVEPTPDPGDRPVVLLVEHDRERLQRLDVLLSERGYTVVSMTRALAQLTRLARALRPRAILLEQTSEGVTEVVRELRSESIPMLVFARDGAVDADLAHAGDADLVTFVERQR